MKHLFDANKVGSGKIRGQAKVIVERVALEKGVLCGACINDGWRTENLTNIWMPTSV